MFAHLLNNVVQSALRCLRVCPAQPRRAHGRTDNAVHVEFRASPAIAVRRRPETENHELDQSWRPVSSRSSEWSLLVECNRSKSVVIIARPCRRRLTHRVQVVTVNRFNSVFEFSGVGRVEPPSSAFQVSPVATDPPSSF